MPCRINLRRTWTARLVLESGFHEESVFATLTYDDKLCAPLGYVPWSLEPDHCTLFMKRLRAAYAPRRVRYYIVGEYGELQERPHYHAALFGVSIAEASLVESAWGLGQVHLGELNTTTAHYICGYTTKKLTNPDNINTQAWLKGRHPEFARMSLKPGIGRLASGDMAKDLLKAGGSKALAELGDVPHEVRISGKKYPMGRYLRKGLREEVGWDQSTPEHVLVDMKIQESALPDEDRWARERRRAASERSAIARTKIHRSKRKL